jgi:hypothetical protein
MAASNNNRHWGGNEFSKTRGVGEPTGTFVYSTLWKQADMVTVKHYISLGHLSDGEIADRYRAVGGSVRAVLEYDCNRFPLMVKYALSGLRAETANDLVHGICNFAFSPELPFHVLDQSRQMQQIPACNGLL